MPFKVLNGEPSYINLLDAISAWQLVAELRNTTGMASAASFKHVSPAGAAIGLPLTRNLAQVHEIENADSLSEVACAYARARGGDLVSSYGDFAAVSDRVGMSLAELLKREVSDGIASPGYEDEAFEILSAKKGGRYLVLEIDPDFEPPYIESREMFGVRLEQPSYTGSLDVEVFDRPITRMTNFSEVARLNLMVATIAMRYTQSNSVCVAAAGQVIGIGAGQQSRIHCTRIACSKADRWMLLQHPLVLGLKLKEGLRRVDRFNVREQYLSWNELSLPERDRLREQIAEWPGEFSIHERANWIRGFKTVMSHDGFIPFRDNIDRAQASSVKYILQPGGSFSDEEVVSACDEYGITMALTGQRLFRH